MIVKHNLKMDLQRPGTTPVISVSQGDALSRMVVISLTSGGFRWAVPQDAVVMMRFRKPDNTGGIYDTLPDGQKAYAVDGNKVSVILAPQVLALAGTVQAQAEILCRDHSLATFLFHIQVERNPASQVLESEDYINLSGQIQAMMEDAISQIKDSGEWDGADGADGKNGITFIPQVSQDGVLAWTNDGGLDNPAAVNIRGPQGAAGANGAAGKDGVTFTPQVSQDGVLAWTNDGGLDNPTAVNIRGPQGAAGANGADGHTPVRGVDYWTTADQEAIQASASQEIQAVADTVPLLGIFESKFYQFALGLITLKTGETKTITGGVTLRFYEGSEEITDHFTALYNIDETLRPVKFVLRSNVVRQNGQVDLSLDKFDFGWRNNAYYLKSVTVSGYDGIHDVFAKIVYTYPDPLEYDETGIPVGSSVMTCWKSNVTPDHNTSTASHTDIRSGLASVAASSEILCSAAGKNIVINDASTRQPRVLTLYGKTTQSATPTTDSPVELVSLGSSGSITITVGVSETDDNPQNLTVSTPNGLPGIPVAADGNYVDENGQAWICDAVDLAGGKYVQRIGRIDSYTDEAVPGVYLSTTGVLSAGATVLYALEAPVETALASSVLTAFAALQANCPKTILSNDAGAYMAFQYVADTKTYIDNKFAALQGG